MLVVSCGGGHQPSEAATSTMKAAEPPADTATESTGLTTQTTEVGEDRSPQEGGALTENADKPAESGNASKPGKQ